MVCIRVFHLSNGPIEIKCTLNVGNNSSNKQIHRNQHKLAQKLSGVVHESIECLFF